MTHRTVRPKRKSSRWPATSTTPVCRRCCARSRASRRDSWSAVSAACWTSYGNIRVYIMRNANADLHNTRQCGIYVFPTISRCGRDRSSRNPSDRWWILNRRPLSIQHKCMFVFGNCNYDSALALIQFGHNWCRSEMPLHNAIGHSHCFCASACV